MFRLKIYYELIKHTEGKSVLLEEYAREMVLSEEMHLDEVDKMLCKLSNLIPFVD
jgi:bacterioferritin